MHAAIARDPQMSRSAMSDYDLTAEEFAGLTAINGSMRQTRPAAEVEIKLRELGLIARSIPSGLPVRTAQGDALVSTSPAT